MIKVKFCHTNNNWLKEQGYTVEEEAKLYDDQLQDILDNTRWYLDNLEFMRQYRVSWGNYSLKGSNIEIARKLAPTPSFSNVKHYAEKS
jgi:hypothetical protein